MQRENGRSIAVSFENAVDILLNVLSLVMGYLLALPFGVPNRLMLDSPETIIVISLTVLTQSFVFMAFNLYRPIPFDKPGRLVGAIFRTNITFYAFAEMVTLLAFDGADRDFALVWLLISAVISTAALISKKRIMVKVVGILRKKQYNLRKVIIVGDNAATTADFVKQVGENAESGMFILGYVGDRINGDVGCDKLGSFKDLAAILDEYKPNDVVFAIDAYDKRHLIRLVNMCDDRCIKVYFLPVIYGFFKTANQIENIGTLPIINIHSTPLDNKTNAFLKRVIDILGSLVLIILSSPVMIAAAIGVLLSSPGPIFFKQERVGKMGKTFTMLKFRSMKVNVGSDNTWTTGEDPRKTRFGTFIRRTSIDELPQLFNVLIGDMSLVGPRPEVPHFVEYFKEIIPLYMVKHYVKPGMTGLAQVRGLRGDTSVEDRILADIEYIENWSLGLDISILLQTPFKAINKQEVYTEEKADAEAEEKTEGEEVTAEAPADTEEHTEPRAELLEEELPPTRGKVLYAASTMTHINNFHLGYIASLKEAGYQVKVMARGDGADYNVPFEKKFFSSANTACRAEIKRILKEEKFDIVFVNTSLAAFHIRLCLPKHNRPRVVNMVHGYLFSKDIGFVKRLALLWSEKLLSKKTDCLIVMNEWDRQIAEKHKLCLERVYFCKGMGASVMPVGTPPERLRREHLCQDKYILLFVGELSARKNQEFLILALNEIKERIPNAVMWFVGDGLGRDELEQLAGKFDLSESVFFLGRRDNACDYMRACDLYVSASRIEGMPFNLIEAMGCGRTVLASRVKGHSDLIEDGKSGFLYTLDNTEEFVGKAVAIANGEMSLSSEDITDRYKEFAKENVFDDTLKIIKESFN